MPKRKPSPKTPEKERFEVLMEEMRSQFRTVIEGLTTLTGRVERLEYRLERVEQKIELLQSAILATSNDMQGLRRDVRSLTERFEDHLKAHTV